MKEVILYHGTRANPASIREHGLLAGGLDRIEKDPATQKYIINKERTLQRVLDEFGMKKEDLPAWIYRGELEYEKDKPIHIHFECSLNNAIGYADMGGEPAYLIRKNILDWIEMKRLGNTEDCLHSQGIDGRRLSKENNRKAKAANGSQCYVVIVKIRLDDPRLEEEGVDMIRRVESALPKIGKTWKEFWKGQAREIRYFGDIKPEDILGIVAVDPKHTIH